MDVIIQNIDPGEMEAQRIIAELDADLVQRYPGEATNGIDVDDFRAAQGYFVVLRANTGGDPIACGAFRPVHTDCVEIKRMYVSAPARGKGYSKLLLRYLEDVARQRGFRGFVLETGVRQPEAIGLYRSMGYFQIPNYGHYARDPNSVCFAKQA